MNINNQNGFTLIEVVIALGVFAFGILALILLQTSSIKGNATANIISTEASWAEDRIERILAMDFDDLKDEKDPGGGLDNKDIATADGYDNTSVDGYLILWNVEDYIMPDPLNSAESTVKAIRVYVQSKNSGTDNEVELNYYKQKQFL